MTTNQLHSISSFFLSIVLNISLARINRVRLSLQYSCTVYRTSSIEARIKVTMLPIARHSTTKGAFRILRNLPSHSLESFSASPNIHPCQRNVFPGSPLFRTSAFSTTSSMSKCGDKDQESKLQKRSCPNLKWNCNHTEIQDRKQKRRRVAQGRRRISQNPARRTRHGEISTS